MEHYKDPGNMAYSRDEKSFPARVMTTLWISVPFKTRMSLRERTRPGLGIIEPCLPSPAKVPPSGPGWLHEIKHDGFRILARRDSAGVRAPDLRGWGASMGFGATGAAGSEATLPTGLLWQPTQHRIVPLWALTAARWRISAGRAGSRWRVTLMCSRENEGCLLAPQLRPVVPRIRPGRPQSI